MAYEELKDVTGIKLGGTNKKTGKPNPTRLEGYFIRVEERINKFNKDKPQKFYVFQTAEGDVGLYGTAGIDREMRKATPGRMTLVIETGETLDTGKGNPMKVYVVKQDKSNAIEVDNETPSYDSLDLDDSGAELEEEEELAPVVHKAVAAPIRAVASNLDSERRARVQAMLGKK